MIDLFTVDYLGLPNDSLYGAIVDFARAQPAESNRHDFKLSWTNDAIKDVAAFANTFGGILIIGVQKNQNDTEARPAGITSTSEIMTSIASAIATNISPTPAYDIAECHKPDEPNTRFCVVRVRPQSSLYLVTKKDISNPVWFRNADQTIKADAAQLRMLIDREMQAPLAGDEMLTERAQALLDEMIIGYDYRDADDWTIGTWQRSESYFKLALIPREGKLSQLDLRDELKFVQLVHRYFPRLQSTIGRTRPVARDAPNRSADFYEYRWYHWNGSYEARWRVTNRLQIGQAMQVKYQDSWSLLDVVVSTVLFMKIGAEWWRSLRYFGDAILLAQINVRNLPVVRGSSLQFLKGFNIGETGNLGMRSEVLNVHSQQRSESSAYVQVNAATMVDTLPGTVTALMNPLLRTLGHAVLWREFEDNIRIIGSEILAR